MQLITEPGISGAFTRDQADNAIPNGTRIIKQRSERGDAHQNGSIGHILGSLPYPEAMIINGTEHLRGTVAGYFVAWDKSPKTAVFVLAEKVRVL